MLCARRQVARTQENSSECRQRGLTIRCYRVIVVEASSVASIAYLLVALRGFDDLVRQMASSFQRLGGLLGSLGASFHNILPGHTFCILDYLNTDLLPSCYSLFKGASERDPSPTKFAAQGMKIARLLEFLHFRAGTVLFLKQVSLRELFEYLLAFLEYHLVPNLGNSLTPLGKIIRSSRKQTHHLQASSTNFY